MRFTKFLMYFFHIIFNFSPIHYFYSLGNYHHIPLGKSEYVFNLFLWSDPGFECLLSCRESSVWASPSAHQTDSTGNQNLSFPFNSWYLRNRCARKEQSRLFDMFKAFDKIVSSDTSDVFARKDFFSRPCVRNMLLTTI